MTRKRGPNSPSMVFRTGYSRPHGGHSKSPNSSRVTGAVSGPRKCGGWAPGATAALAEEGAPGVPGAGEAPDAGLEVCAECFMYQAAPKATPRTAMMIKKGNKRFI